MPVRYVLAVLLTVALLGVGVAGVEQAGDLRGERQVDGELGTIEDASLSLLETEEPPPPGHSPPRRLLEIDLPTDGFVSEPVDLLVFERQANTTQVTYAVDGRAKQTTMIDAPIERNTAGEDVVDLSGKTGSQTVILELVRDSNGTPVIEMTVE